ncbi:MAG: Uma2 family endonuclease [Planctomycetaceae bacterium]|nr:Uma2 family endonuclease [Planctomycetaceae bacterium]
MSIGATALIPDDLLAMPNGKSFELVDEEPLELKMGRESGWIAGVIFGQFLRHGQATGLGRVFPEGTGFICFPDDPSRVRKSHTSFALRARQQGGPAREGYGKFTPDLIVEVVSPRNWMWKVESKVQDWLSVGAKIVWVVMPPTLSVRVCRQNPTGDVSVQRLTGDQELQELIPGFRMRVSECFVTTSI